MKQEWLTVDEAANALAVHPQTVRRWLRNEQLTGTMLSRRAGYRIRASEVERVLEEGLPEAKVERSGPREFVRPAERKT